VEIKEWVQPPLSPGNGVKKEVRTHKQLDFGKYNITEWREFKRIYREMFWDELEERVIEEAKRMLQEQIYAEFETGSIV